MKIFSIDHTAVNCSGLEESKRFYGEKLGLEEIARPDFDFGGAWYRIGERQQIHLIEQTDLPPAKDRINHHFALQVEDVAAIQKELKSRGLEAARGPKHRPDGVQQIFFTDPDGYLIEFTDAGFAAGSR